MDWRIEKGVRVRHLEYGQEGVIIGIGAKITIRFDNGRHTQVNKIILWEHYKPVKDESDGGSPSV